MTQPRHVAVIDIGKTNAKLALVDLTTLAEIAVVTRSNTVRPGPPWPHFDVEGHWNFLLDALGQFHSTHGVDAISVTTHGACVALLAADGSLAAPILDYEHRFSAEIVAAYDAMRPPFSQTGSPRFAGGLNIGAQLHWQFLTDPTLRERTARIVTYPQYWGHRPTGNTASDVASIGCHTDLWLPDDLCFKANWRPAPALVPHFFLDQARRLPPRFRQILRRLGQSGALMHRSGVSMWAKPEDHSSRRVVWSLLRPYLVLAGPTIGGLLIGILSHWHQIVQMHSSP